MNLTVIEKNAKTEYRLDDFNKEVIGFGRQTDSDIVLRSSYVSRLHGCIYIDSGKWYIKDLESSNGIIYNEKRIDSMMITGNERFIIKSQNGEFVELIFSQNENDYNLANENKSGIKDIVSDDSYKRKLKKKKIIIVSLLMVILAAIIATVLIIVFSKKDYKKMAAESTTKAFKDTYSRGNYEIMMNELKKEDYQVMYEYLSQNIQIDDINNGEDLKRKIQEDSGLEEESYSELDDSYTIVDNSATSFTLKDNHYDYYMTFNAGEAELISEINDSVLRDFFINHEQASDEYAEIDADAEEEINEFISWSKKFIDDADLIYKVPITMEIHEDDYEESISFYDLVYVKNKECKSLWIRLNICVSVPRYLSKSLKYNDVSSGKLLKTAIEVSLANEEIYAYLTDTDSYSYIYFWPDGTDSNSIVLDVPYMHNYDDYITSNDIEGDVKSVLFANIGDNIPSIDFKPVVDENSSGPVCYVAAISNIGTVRVYISGVDSGFYCDSEGNTYYGYQLAPDLDKEYQ